MPEEQEKESLQHSAHRKKARVVNAIIIINALIFVVTIWLGTSYNVNLYDYLGLHHPKSDLFHWSQFATHIFMHGGYFHIFINMFVLWMFGTVLENIWGAKRFLVFYFFTGLGAAALHIGVSTISLNNLERDAAAYIQDPSYARYIEFKEEHMDALPPAFSNEADELAEEWEGVPASGEYRSQSIELVEEYVSVNIDRPTVGASGAIYGVLLAFGVLFPNVYIFLYFLFPIKAKYFVILIGVIELYSGVFGQNVSIANFAHLGGMLFGFLLLKVWGLKAPRPDETYAEN